MIGKLEFNLPEEFDEFQDAQNASKYKCAVEDIYQQVFRPAFKHGYPDEVLQKMVDENPIVFEVIERLKKLYFNVLNDHDIE
jgi:hypothetical protein